MMPAIVKMLNSQVFRPNEGGLRAGGECVECAGETTNLFLEHDYVFPYSYGRGIAEAAPEMGVSRRADES